MAKRRGSDVNEREDSKSHKWGVRGRREQGGGSDREVDVSESNGGDATGR